LGRERSDGAEVSIEVVRRAEKERSQRAHQITVTPSAAKPQGKGSRKRRRMDGYR